MATTILLVDDHAIFRAGLRMLLEEYEEMQIVGEAGDGQAAIEAARLLAPDVVVMDISMPGLDGIEATRQLLTESPATSVIALSIHGEKQFVEDMLRAGATGYLLKESAPEELVLGIQAVNRGEIYLSTAITDVVVSQYMRLLAEESTPNLAANDGDTGFIVSTKLHRPPISPQLVQRARLQVHFDQGFLRPLTLVSAPAGYGKSTAASQWLATCDVPSAWLSLDEDDNDLRVFLTYVVAAITELFPQALSATSAMLRGQSLPPLHTINVTLTNELAQLPARFILTLDDFHHIDEPAILQWLGELLHHPPRTLHLVLTTRADPALDLLSLRAYRQMGEVRARELRFTADETAEFLEHALDTRVDEAISTALTAKTEGWVTGLQLATLSVQNRADLDSLSIVLPGEQQTWDYLIAETLARQPREVQRCLLQTAILDRFCASLSEAVCASSQAEAQGEFDGNAFIDWLTAKNLFVVALDHGRKWFRYHHLFQGLLQKQLAEVLDAKEIAGLHARASRWFAANNLIDEALRHALKASDIEYAVALVVQHRYALMNSEQWNRLERWLLMLPVETIETNPILLSTRAYLVEQQGRISETFAYRDKAEDLLSTLPPASRERTTLEGELAVLRGEQFLLAGDGHLAAENFAQALKCLPPEALHIWSYAIGGQVLAHQMAGDIGRGLKIIHEILNEHAVLPAITEARMMLWFCLAYWMEGDLNGLQQSALRCRQLGEQHALPESLQFGRYFLGVMHYVRNELVDAEQTLAAVVDDPITARPMYLNHSAAALARIYTAQDREEDAANTVEFAISHAVETNNALVLAVARAFQVELALTQGKVQAAKNLSEGLDYDLFPPIWFFFTPQLTPVKLLLAEKRPESLAAARDKLDELDTFLRKTNRKSVRIDLLALYALILDAQGDEQAALEKLHESLLIAMPGGFIRNYVDLGAKLASLLVRLKKRTNENGLAKSGEISPYIDKILAAFSTVDSSPTHQQRAIIEPLTARELQILRLLATELNTDEIADQLVVSVATVRSHTKNLYGKLGAHSRFEAVLRARELNLI